jgi:hypothetical protein
MGGLCFARQLVATERPWRSSPVQRFDNYSEDFNIMVEMFVEKAELNPVTFC